MRISVDFFNKYLTKTHLNVCNLNEDLQSYITMCLAGIPCFLILIGKKEGKQAAVIFFPPVAVDGPDWEQN